MVQVGIIFNHFQYYILFPPFSFFLQNSTLLNPVFTLLFVNQLHLYTYYIFSFITSLRCVLHYTTIILLNIPQNNLIL